MRLLFSFIIISIVLLGACNNRESNLLTESKPFVDPESPPKVKFDTLFYDFGTLVQGESVSHTFKFKNLGKSDLVIMDAYSTCGCTVPKYTKKPLKHEEEGELEVIFNSEGRKGVQYKMINLKLNTPGGEKSIGIRANVVENNK